MRTVLLGLALALTSATAAAQDMRPGIASIAQISTEMDGRYVMDGNEVDARKLKRTLVALDEQLPIGYLHLRPGSAAISPAQLAEIQRLARDIGAQVLIERDGRMEPVDGPAAQAADTD